MSESGNIERLFARLRDLALKLGARMRWPTDLVEDAYQDAMIRLLSDPAELARCDADPSWALRRLLTMIRNLIIDEFRRRRRREQGGFESDAEIVEAVTRFTTQVRRRLDREHALDQIELALVAAGHTTTLLVFQQLRCEPLSSREIGERLGLDPGRVRHHMHRIKKMIETDPALRRLGARSVGDPEEPNG